jgi:glycosyltransferase involved in cell wall biosynthesis
MITLPPAIGGVATMARAMTGVLEAEGYAVSAAHRVAFADDPTLSVPTWRALSRRPTIATACDNSNGMLRYGVGTWLPEFEWAHYRPWQPWRALIERFTHHVVVTGNVLPASGLAQMGIPALSWVATSYVADRVDRFRAKPLLRRGFDALFNRPVCQRLERFTLERSHVLALSDHTARDLRAVAPNTNLAGVLRMPVEGLAERPRQRPGRTPLVIGFAGRLSDPRKNVGLLLDTFRRLRSRTAVELRLVGDLTPDWLQRQGAGDLLDAVRMLPPHGPEDMPGFYDGIDILVISSRQEGLAIVGLEAMARGVPVVSTRCGGPEDYVLQGETGYLTGFDAEEMAQAVLQATASDAHYARLSANARDLVQQRHSLRQFHADTMGHFHTLFGA